jgi:hypothetical protein
LRTQRKDEERRTGEKGQETRRNSEGKLREDKEKI